MQQDSSRTEELENGTDAVNSIVSSAVSDEPPGHDSRNVDENESARDAQKAVGRI
jgi:hypothetical protein